MLKIITICGSLRFEDEIRRETERLELEGNCVLSVVYPYKTDRNGYAPLEHKMFDEAHKRRIELSEAIFVVNVGGYVGESVRSEIEYATRLGKEIVYLEH